MNDHAMNRPAPSFDLPLPRRRFQLVENPAAGRGASSLVPRVAAALEARGATLIRSAAAGTEPCDALLAAGGDGTIRALAPIAARLGVPIGVVPAGTGNVMACELSLPRDPDLLADLLMRAPAVEIPTARANGAPFLLMAGAGFDGHVIARLDMDLKRRIGKAAYATPVLRALVERAPMLNVTLDGEPREAHWVIVTRSSRYGGSFRLAPDAHLHHPGFTAVLFHGAGRATRIAQLLSLAAGRLDRRRDVTMVRCTRVTLTAPTPLPVELDGDPFTSTPVDIDACGPPLRLIVPERYAMRG